MGSGSGICHPPLDLRLPVRRSYPGPYPLPCRPDGNRMDLIARNRQDRRSELRPKPRNVSPARCSLGTIMPSRRAVFVFVASLLAVPTTFADLAYFEKGGEVQVPLTI